jgi:antirestriction protein ArdC
MSGHPTRAHAGNDRASLYTEITDKIIAELEAGRIPWVHRRPGGRRPDRRRGAQDPTTGHDRASDRRLG